MSDKRISKFVIVVGKKGVGKTYSTMELIRSYVRSIGGGKGRKVLVFDVNKEYVDIKTIALKDVYRFVISSNVEARRVLPIHDDGSPMSIDEMQQTLFFILKYYSNGMLVLEDLNKIIGDSISNTLVSVLATCRHLNIDLTTNFQTKSKAGQPKLLGMLNLMRIFKTVDRFKRSEKKFDGHMEILELAEILVDKKHETDIYWSCFVDFDDYVIRGDFTESEFREAIAMYISEHEGDTVKKYMNRKDRKGNKLYNYQQAMELVEKEMFEDFYPND